ncbi:MAG: hypothetical protein KDA51_09735, partial [Planctomycetales bacterium]|nr:hypothetical protein [Planctomycetales bacterium]
NRTRQQLRTFLPPGEPQRSQVVQYLAGALAREAEQHPQLLARIDGESAASSPIAEVFKRYGFFLISRGLFHRGTAVPRK